MLIVGDGALRFAVAHGFKKEDLLTEASREKWLRWREQMSDIDDWGPPKRGTVPAYDAPPKTPQAALDPDLNPLTWPEKRWGTINCLALDEAGDLSGITTTSGLAFKIPGRIGDSPLVGCGLYVDNAVGAAGSTGVGEECIKIVGAHTVVELHAPGPASAGGGHGGDQARAVEARAGHHVEPEFLRDEQGRAARRRGHSERQQLRGARRRWRAAGGVCVGPRTQARLIARGAIGS